ncbi:MAG: RluA family pseudouridine synthase [Dehalococcoidales bacterium]|nr:RluA family pseudouridine synthase [Dehalococcoidales bacterium]
MARSPNHYQFTIEQPSARLDKCVSANCPGLSRTQAQRLIDGGYVTVNGKAEKAGYKPDSGDRIEVNIPPPSPSDLLPEAIPIKILYEDNDLLVIDKPAGLTVHPAPGHPAHTLVNALLSHLSELADTDDARPGIVHRLDKDTSGIMLIAKNAPALANLSEQFKSRSIKKAYLTLVRGHLKPERGVIEAPIGRDPGDRKKMAITGESRGRHARTNYRVIKYVGSNSLLEITPETGRTHQIRVHLSAIGYPVAGDGTYGTKSVYLNRQFLHAHRLGFRLPSSGEYVEFESPLPSDLEQALKEIK